MQNNIFRPSSAWFAAQNLSAKNCFLITLMKCMMAKIANILFARNVENIFVWETNSSTFSIIYHIYLNETNNHTFLIKNILFSRLHVESKCGTEKSHTCSFCQAKFLNQYTLKTHIQIHVGKKNSLCGYCPASFLSHGQLIIHERSHTKDKPHTCSICNKSFSHRESLVTHSSVHTGIKPYICECNEIAQNIQSWIKLCVWSLGECCSSQFSCVGNLIKHRKARPETCGLSKYSNRKCAPRASTKGNHHIFHAFPFHSFEWWITVNLWFLFCRV